MALAALVCALSFAISVLSGLVGIGGGVVLAPALLFVPAAVGLGTLEIKPVSGLTSVQALCACISGAWGHHRFGTVHRPLVLWMGSGVAASGLAGAMASRWVSNELLMMLFAGLALVAAAMMLAPRPESSGEASDGRYTFPRARALVIAAGVGGVGGMVGQGGAFLLIPLMLHVLRLPLRVVIGNSLAIVSFAAGAGLIGKIAAGQVPADLAAAVVIGAVPGAQLGSWLSIRLRPWWLHQILAVVIAAAAVQIALEALALWSGAER